MLTTCMICDACRQHCRRDQTTLFHGGDVKHWSGNRFAFWPHSSMRISLIEGWNVTPSIRCSASTELTAA